MFGWRIGWRQGKMELTKKQLKNKIKELEDKIKLIKNRGNCCYCEKCEEYIDSKEDRIKITKHFINPYPSARMIGQYHIKCFENLMGKGRYKNMDISKITKAKQILKSLKWFLEHNRNIYDDLNKLFRLYGLEDIDGGNIVSLGERNSNGKTDGENGE